MKVSPTTLSILTPCILTFGLLNSGAAPVAAQQFTFSVDWKGPTIAQNASLSVVQITEGDLLTFGPGSPGFGPLALPSIALTGNNLGLTLYNVCSGHLPGQPCGVEIDAISQGADALLRTNTSLDSQQLWFSTDEYALGLAQAHSGPSVATEGGAVADLSSDIFITMGLMVGPIGINTGPGRHVGVFDGDGLPSNAPSNRVYPGIGLIEPNVPNNTVPNTGDNLDALDLGAAAGFPNGGYYFSVDSAIFDPLATATNSGTSTIQGVSGADVLWVASPLSSVTVFAPALALGLDLVGGPDTDDLDALVLVENGNGSFEASLVPYDWANGTTDMLLFSVRRGSAVIGQPDSIFGIPIEEGDVLTTPMPASNGGLSPFPGIFYSAESLGLRTNRTHGAVHGDDIDAMDFENSPCFDCNNNGVEDAVDIATGSSSDANDNGIPDECEAIQEYGYCTPGLAPCNNPDENAGCANSTGAGAHLYFTGTHSVSADDLILHADGLPGSAFGIFFMGMGQVQIPFGDGLRCVNNRGPGLFRYPVQLSTPVGTMTEGPAIAAYSCQQFLPPGCISAGATWDFQAWYRDPSGPCGSGFNTTNALEVMFGL